MNTCSNCGTALRDGEAVCTGCGQAVESAASAANLLLDDQLRRRERPRTVNEEFVSIRDYEQNQPRDLTGRLNAMGIVQLTLSGLTGILFLFSVLAVILQRALPKVAGQASVSPVVMVMSAVMYALFAAFFFWIGLGSLRFRRWVRPVVLSVMWPFFIVGVFTFLIMLFFIPHGSAVFDSFAEITVTGEPIPATVVYAATVFVLALIFITTVAIPGLHVLLYRSRAVQQTCNAKDPRERWTDNCPVQVLGMVIWLVLTGALLIMVVPMGILPLFCLVVEGPVAMAALVVLAIIAVVLARAVHQRRASGWWGTLVYFQFLLIGVGLGFLFVDLSSLNEILGPVGSGQAWQTASAPRAVSYSTTVFFLANAAALAIYLFTVRKYFKNGNTQEREEGQ